MTLTEQKLNFGCVQKSFDYVSEDGKTLGDAKFYKDCNAPSAKLATISECVFLLEKCKAERRFIVFGNDRNVAARWLSRYGSLLNGIEFYFLNEAGLERMA